MSAAIRLGLILVMLVVPRAVVAQPGGDSAPNAPAAAVTVNDKLLLTNGVTGVEGGGGGGLATWATISGRGTDRRVGASAHLTLAELPDYGWQSHGVAVGLFDRVEFSYARQNFDTRAVGAALGLGQGYRLNQDVYGAKLRLAGDAVYGSALMPQIAVGVQHKRNLDAGVVAAVGGRKAEGTDVYLSATKLFLSHSVLANATVRYTKANQMGLLGFGGDKQDDATVQFEGSLGYQLSRSLLIGGEYRTKPDNLAFAKENDAIDLFAAWAVDRHITLTGAYVDLGDIATAPNQRGGLVSLQLAF